MCYPPKLYVTAAPASLLRERWRTRFEIPQNEARVEKEEGANGEGGEGGVRGEMMGDGKEEGDDEGEEEGEV